MAYVKRYEATYHTKLHDHIIEIYQDGFVGSLKTGVLSRPGATIEFSGDDKELTSPIRAQEITIPLEVVGSNETDLITDILNSDEGDFSVVWKRDGAVFFRGIIVNDSIEEEDGITVGTTNIRAICGLGRLKDVEMSLGDTRMTWVERFIDILKETGTGSLYGSTDVFLRTVFRYFPNGLSNAVDPLQYVRWPETNVVFRLSDTGTSVGEYINFYDLLENLLVNIGCRVQQTNGFWWIYQPREWLGETVTYHDYQVGHTVGADPANPTTPAIAVNQSLAIGRDMIAGNVPSKTNLNPIHRGTYLREPAFRETKMVYNVAGTQSFFFYSDTELIYNSTQNTFGVGTSPASVNAGSTIRLWLEGNSKIRTTWNEATLNGLYPVDVKFQLQIKVGTQYYGNGGWTSTPVWYTAGVKTLSVLRVNGATVTHDVSWYGAGIIKLDLQNIPVSGVMTVQPRFQFSFPSPVLIDITKYWIAENFSMRSYLLATQSTFGGIEYKALNNVHPNTTNALDLGEVYLGDNDDGVFNYMEFWTGSTWNRTEYWKHESSVSEPQLPLVQLVVRDIQALHMKPKRVFEGDIWGGWDPMKAILYDRGASIIYTMMFNSGSYNSHDDIWNVSAHVLAYSTTSLVLEDNGIGLANSSQGGPVRGITAESGLGVFEAGKLSSSVSGTITSIPIDSSEVIQVKPGERLWIVDPRSGLREQVTVNAFTFGTSGAGITSIPIESKTLENTFGLDAVIVRDPKFIGNNIHNKHSYTSDGTMATTATMTSIESATVDADGNVFAYFGCAMEAGSATRISFEFYKGAQLMDGVFPFVVDEYDDNTAKYYKSMTIISTKIPVSKGDKIEVRYTAAGDVVFINRALHIIDVGI